MLSLNWDIRVSLRTRSKIDCEKEIAIQEEHLKKLGLHPKNRPLMKQIFQTIRDPYDFTADMLCEFCDENDLKFIFDNDFKSLTWVKLEILSRCNPSIEFMIETKLPPHMFYLSDAKKRSYEALYNFLKNDETALPPGSLDIRPKNPKEKFYMDKLISMGHRKMRYFDDQQKAGLKVIIVYIRLPNCSASEL